MDAKQKFKKGDRVKHSEMGLEALRPIYSEREGEVVGFSRDKGGVRIRWDGYGSISLYYMDYIKKLKSKKPDGKNDL